MPPAPTFCCSRSRSPRSARSEAAAWLSSSSRRPRAARSVAFLAAAAATAASSAGSPSPAPSSGPRRIALPAQPGARSSSSRLWGYGAGQRVPIPLASGLTAPARLTLAARAHSSPGAGCAGARRCREKTVRSSELTTCCRSAKRSGPWAAERQRRWGQVPAAGSELRGTAPHGTARHGAPTFQTGGGVERAVEAPGLRAGSGEAGSALPALLILPEEWRRPEMEVAGRWQPPVTRGRHVPVPARAALQLLGSPVQPGHRRQQPGDALLVAQDALGVPRHVLIVILIFILILLLLLSRRGLRGAAVSAMPGSGGTSGRRG